MLIDNLEIAVKGKLFKVARLRHEKFEFAKDQLGLIEKLREGRPVADVFTFVQDTCDQNTYPGFVKKLEGASFLPITTHEQWWKALDFKVRNKIRKAQKSGVELRPAILNDEFVKGVQSIYDESPLRQGRKFIHYGKSLAVLKDDLSSFPECTFFIGAYYQSELIGFMKLFEGNNVLRTVHIIAKISHRDKPVMDALISRAVEICEQKKFAYFHYGSWTSGGLGDFRIKHGFQRFEVPRYFLPLTLRGKLMLKLNLHHGLKERLPEKWVEKMLGFRKRALALRNRVAKGSAVS
jgi:hypothetical protein